MPQRVCFYSLPLWHFCRSRVYFMRCFFFSSFVARQKFKMAGSFDLLREESPAARSTPSAKGTAGARLLTCAQVGSPRSQSVSLSLRINERFLRIDFTDPAEATCMRMCCDLKKQNKKASKKCTKFFICMD